MKKKQPADRASRQEPAKKVRLEAKKYERGSGNKVKGVVDKKLRATIATQEERFEQAAASAAAAEILLPSEAGYLEAEGMEKTYKFTQRDIRDHVDLSTASNAVDFKLPHFGPYSVSYGRSGRHMLLGGQKGHLAAVDCLRKSIVTEFNVQEAVRSVCFLHNETLFAVAQKKYVYIYDNSGLEIHCMREHSRVQHMQFLPYHFLLTTIGDGGVLQYRDTSTGKLVASHRTKLGPCPSMAQNPHNAVIHTGHNNGTVGLWSPTVGTPLVKMMCHKGPVRALDVDLAGRVMVTAGADGQMKVWDLRMLRLRHAYFTPTPASSVCISQRGLLAVSFGPHVQIWQDALEHKAKSPYMNHSLPGSVISSAQFRPYEDILGIGYDQGLCNMVVPGSGEPNFDSFVANPFETKKQRREGEVHSLLEKLQPEMIALDPDAVVASVDRGSSAEKAEEWRQTQEQRDASKPAVKEKRKARGRSKIGRKLKNKTKNVWTEEKEKLVETLKRDKEERQQQHSQSKLVNAAPAPLQRFVKK